MKLLCINANEIVFPGVVTCTGLNLEEGKIYETIAKPFTDEHDLQSYYITGLGAKLACRFTELLDDSKEESKSIEEQLQEAVDNDNYELAIELRDKLKK